MPEEINPAVNDALVTLVGIAERKSIEVVIDVFKGRERILRWPEFEKAVKETVDKLTA